MKIFRHRNLMGCIYALLMAIPFVAVAVKCAYVVVNKNANQSYSNRYIESINTLNNGATLITGESYIATYDATLNTTGSQTFYFSQSNVDFATAFNVSQVDSIALYSDGRAYTYLWNGTSYVNNSGKNNYWGVELLSFQYIFDRKGTTNPTTINNNGNTKTSIIVLQNDKLDNVFYYAIDEVTNNDIGNVHFFDWFSNMFLIDNATNNRFVGYVNWYMNYALLVSCAFILFLVLMWMINFARRLLERGMNYDF